MVAIKRPGIKTVAKPAAAVEPFRIRLASSHEHLGLTGLIYGPSGVGKTSLARTLLNYYEVGDILVINVDAGDSVLNDLDLPMLDITSGSHIQILKMVHQKILSKEMVVKVIFMDSVSELETYMRNIVTSTRGKPFPTIKEFGDAAYKLREYLRLYRDLRNLGIDVFFCALEQDMDIQNNTEGVITKCVPYVSKKMVIDVCGMVDFVAHMEMDPKSDLRWFRMESNERYIAKKRFPWLEKFERPDLGGLVEKIKKGGSNLLPAESNPQAENMARDLDEAPEGPTPPGA